MNAAGIQNSIAAALAVHGEAMYLRQRSDGAVDPTTWMQTPGSAIDTEFQGLEMDGETLRRVGLDAIAGERWVIGCPSVVPEPGDGVVLVATDKESVVDRVRPVRLDGTDVYYTIRLQGDR